MAGEVPDDVQWRQTGAYLWVGSRDGYHVGVIEHGRGYVAIDHTGEVRGRYRSLFDAQAALNAFPSWNADDPALHPQRDARTE